MKRSGRCIILWSGSRHQLNHGDVAMLQVAVRRLRRLCPRHRILVFVDRTDLLERYCPDVEPLNPDAINLWAGRSLVPERILRVMPQTAQRWIRQMQRQLLERRPSMYNLLAAAKQGVPCDLEPVLQVLALTDAIVAPGGGFINDNFPSVAHRILADLLAGASISIPIAMFSQGLGPVGNPEILRIAQELFPRLTMISLREGRQSYRLASEWMREESARIRVTGDDAIEMAYNCRPATLGDGIGANIRLAAYSGVNLGQAARIAEALKSGTAIVGAPLVPIVISRYPKESDVESLRALLGDESLLRCESDYDTPEKTALTVGRCRVVVTGSYHAGVFALAQGIPVIGLVASQYYDEKFSGLCDQFGCAVELIRLNEPDFDTRLRRSVQTMWDVAPTLRERLLLSSREQIELSGQAYSDFAAVVCGKSGDREVAA